MIKHTPDDGRIAVPATPSKGEIILTNIESKAKLIYPDHATSREVYIREMTAAELTRLADELDEVNHRIAGLEK